MYNVSFPNLGLYFNINPVAFSIGNINIYWYGIIIATAIILGLAVAKLIDGRYGIKSDDVEEFILWAIPIGVICARLYYVVFSWKSYEADLLSIFKIWEGGLAIYGGIIGAFITGLVYCKVKKISFLDLTDYVVPLLALGQAIGRWGNFVNREAYGVETDGFFRMEILKKAGEYISVHPTFLYESVGLIFIFAILMLTKRRFSGEKTALYFFMYGVLRSFIEWLRVDSLMLFNVKISMVLSIVFAVVALGFIICNLVKLKKKEK